MYRRGEVPERYESLARYLAKYVVSPPISIRRIDGYDGETVGYHYRSHKTEKVEGKRVEVYTFFLVNRLSLQLVNTLILDLQKIKEIPFIHSIHIIKLVQTVPLEHHIEDRPSHQVNSESWYQD